MSKRFRIQTDMAFDFAASMTTLPLTPTEETFLDSLEIELTNKQDKVLVEGVFSLSMISKTILALEKVSITINFYRDAALTDQAYSFDETLATGAALLEIPPTNYQVPIQFLDSPPLKSTEDTAEYYITITLNQLGISLLPTDVELTQYTVTAEEIA